MDFQELVRLPSDGWRKTAVINTSIVAFFLVANFSILIWSVAKSGISGNNVFSKDDCNKISLLNTFLHLLLNIASSLIIASSNFFMQVLNSPTRAEVDRAHARKHWLDIGVPSLRNVLNVSPYKSLAWLLFSLSSVPIHLLFNSSVFSMDYSGSEWSMALVSEPILHGAPYSLPGAALTLNGTQCADPKDEDGSYDFGVGAYGPEGLSQKVPDSMATMKATATQNLSVSDCKSEYQACQGLHKYRNLLLVIDSDGEPTDPQGWDISEIYDMEETVGNVYNLTFVVGDYPMIWNKTFSSMWQAYLENASMSQLNSLWFTSACYKRASYVSDVSSDGCFNSCTGPLGISQSLTSSTPRINNTEVRNSIWEFPWLRVNHSVSSLRSGFAWRHDNVTRIPNHMMYEDLPKLWPNKCKGIPRPLYRTSTANKIRVKYCLAEPFEKGCKVAISNPLLSVVTVCIFIKLVLCVVVVSALRDDPLVTPGDAVASFIKVPDPATFGKCAAAVLDIRFRALERKPQRWRKRSKRLAHAISPTTWAMNYLFFLILLIILGKMMNISFYNYPLSDG